MDFLPMPQCVKTGEGVFALRYDTKITLQNTQPSALLYAQKLRDAIRDCTGLRLAILRGEPRPGEIVLCQDSAVKADTYTLTVTPEGVRVTGGSDESVLHGVMTLCQWVQRHGARLPAISVEDWPDLPSRGYYLDCSRGRVPTLDTLKAYADLLCRYKINEWQLYIEHTYLFRDFSEAWRDDTPLTAEEIMALDSYCRARHIELIPSLASFGHMYKILSTKTCAPLCELADAEKQPFSYTYAGAHHTLNVSNPGVMAFAESLITEYMSLFTSRKFNICCDETFDLGKDRSRELAAQKGEHALYMTHVVGLCRFLLNKGITPMFWGDIMWRHPEAYQEIPEGVICLNWGYLPDQRENEIRDLAAMGATQYACPGVCTWNRWFPLLRQSFSNIRAMCAHGHKYGAIGLLNTDWGDYGHICHPWFSLPGILYGAAFGWHSGGLSFDDVNRAVSALAYGDREGGFMEAFAALCDHEVFDWNHAVQWIECDNALGRRKLMEEVDLSRVPGENAAIDQALERLAEAAPHMAADRRPVVQAMEISARGVKLWNEIACHIAAREGQATSPAESGEALAGALESWYHAYMAVWRTVSKESSAAHTLKLITDYADWLRGR